MYYILMCRSLTTAQKAQRLLQKKGVYAVVTKAPQAANPHGCTYGVRVADRYLAEASSELSRAGIMTETVAETRDPGGGHA